MLQGALQCVTVCCRVCCSVLQCAAVCCISFAPSKSAWAMRRPKKTRILKNQCAAVCVAVCAAVCVAVCCSVCPEFLCFYRAQLETGSRNSQILKFSNFLTLALSF